MHRSDQPHLVHWVAGGGELTEHLGRPDVRDPVERGDGVGADVEPAQPRQLAEPGQALEPVACRDDDLQPGQRRQGLKGPQEVVLRGVPPSV